MRVLVLTRYERLGSSSRVRFYQYFPYLKSQGIELVSAPFFSDEYVKSLYAGRAISKPYILRAYLRRLLTLAKSPAFDILWVEKELFPWMPAWFERLLHLFKAPYVVDYDDAVFHRYDMHPSPLVRAVLGRKIDGVMRSAALVIAGNEYLAERAHRAGAGRVEILPSVVDVDLYKLKKDAGASPFRIGWVGSPVTAPYLDEVRGVLDTLAQELSLQVSLIGSGEIRRFGRIETVIRPWTEEAELSIGELFDVGIMPLVDGPFERGKCGYKLVQYMAAGLPVVASPIGVNNQIVVPGENGFLAASTAEWLEAFRALGRNLEVRSQLGESGRRRAEQMYNLKGTAPKLLDLFSGVRKL